MRKLLIVLFCLLALTGTALAMGHTTRCNICGQVATYMGENFTDAWGIHYVYECPNGHRVIK